ncbi:hypothetical protein [Azospirillum sp. TSO22-1]|uniref:hypothetical protein n=1 Tax=Azospirillum sp. TSO22-1 TaxID=716789 RepID=UPI000D608803|nr:hypothetical protein [Azospirillum sp. TSO22-1]PWC44262.1 hypothetical protein TSO221_18380 [Azospirillum sp. TSO22-1]
MEGVLSLGVFGLPHRQLEAVRAGAFELLDVSPDQAAAAPVAAFLLGWDGQAPAAARRVRGAGYGGPLIAALDGHNVDAIAAALAHGCDDAQAFPLHPRELAARIAAIRRRAAPPLRTRVRCGRLEIGRDGSDPLVDGKPLKVSPNCAKVLGIVAAARHPVPLPRIATALYGDDPPPSKTVNTYLCMLRSIMAAATGEDGWLALHDGGYVLHRPVG